MSDADWGGDKQTRKSVSGFIEFYPGNSISLFFKKQNCVALSTMEAEYLAACSACQQLISIQGVLSEFVDCNIPVSKVDNLSACHINDQYFRELKAR